MRKFWKILAVLLGVIIVLLWGVPFAFQGQIESVIKREGGKLLKADFDFEKIDISLLRNFPHATVSISDFYLQGIGEVSADTLVKSKQLSATVNLLSLFGDGGYEITNIFMDETKVHAVVGKDGKANWDVMKMDDEENSASTHEVSSTEDDSFRIQLKGVKVNDLTVVYQDYASDNRLEINNLHAMCKGDFASDASLLDLQLESEAVTFRSGTLPLLNKAKLEADLDIQADFKGGKFVLSENRICLNAIEVAADGWVAMLDNGWDMDLKLKSSQIAFKDLLSLVPAIYAKDFKSLKADGKVTMDAYAKGLLNGDKQVPSFKLNLQVEDGQFRYPKLPSGVEDIHIHLIAENPGGLPDLTTLQIKPFHLSLAKNPIAMEASLRTPISDPAFQLKAKGKLDLSKVKDVYPLDDLKLNGWIDADVAMEGKLSYIEKEIYDKIMASGNVSLKNMILSLPELPEVEVKESAMAFAPRYVALKSTTIRMGENDLTLDSKLENYVGYLLKGTTLRGSLNVSSHKINLNDFMHTDSTVVVSDTALVEQSKETSGGILKVPSNLDFTVNADLKKVTMDNMCFDNVKGLLVIKDSKVDMKNLSMQTMGGSVVMNGAYATPQGKQPSMNAGFALNQLSFAQAYEELGMVRSMAPIFKELKGEFSGDVKINTLLDGQMHPVMESVKGEGSISTKSLSLSGVKFIDQVATIVKKPSLKEIRVKDLDIDFTIDKGRVSTAPFDLKMGDYTMNLSGSTGMDQSIDYKGKITLPASVGGKMRLSTVDMNIGGTFSSPKVSIDMGSVLKNMAGQILGGLSGGNAENDKDSVKTDEKKKNGLLEGVKNLFKKK